ncbi:MAG: hypothetical protein ACXVIO_12745, partial [Candidatus Angelobacter sp.]
RFIAPGSRRAGLGNACRRKQEDEKAEFHSGKCYTVDGFAAIENVNSTRRRKDAENVATLSERVNPR